MSRADRYKWTDKMDCIISFHSTAPHRTVGCIQTGQFNKELKAAGAAAAATVTVIALLSAAMTDKHDTHTLTEWSVSTTIWVNQYQNGKQFWILVQQEMMEVAVAVVQNVTRRMCKTTVRSLPPEYQHSVFYSPDALPVA